MFEILLAVGIAWMIWLLAVILFPYKRPKKTYVVRITDKEE